MDTLLLPPSEIAKLVAHRHAKTRREPDRIKAVVLLGKGWTATEVAEAPLLDEDTVRNCTIPGGRAAGLAERRLHGWGRGHLDEAQIQALEAHLRERTYLTAR